MKRGMARPVTDSAVKPSILVCQGAAQFKMNVELSVAGRSVEKACMNSRQCRLALLVVVLAVAGASSLRAQKALAWLLDYRDINENRLAWDPQFAPFLQHALPTVVLPGCCGNPVNTDAMTFLGGVPGPIEVRHQRYFAAAGCPAHACDSRAMIWVDTESDVVVFVKTDDEKSNVAKATRGAYPIASTRLYLVTKTPMTPDTLPDDLRRAVVRWLHLNGVLQVTDITLMSAVNTLAVTTDQLCWTGRCAAGMDWLNDH
jgi:hypothetical protein